MFHRKLDYHNCQYSRTMPKISAARAKDYQCGVAVDQLLGLTEAICKATGQPKGTAKVAFVIMERLADWLIWRKHKR